MLKRYGMSTEHDTAVAAILNGQRYLESTALLKVMQRLGRPFSLMRAGYFMPRLWRGYLYRRVALNRYQLFGITNQCLIPSADNQQHFLEYIIHAKI